MPLQKNHCKRLRYFISVSHGWQRIEASIEELDLFIEYCADVADEARRTSDLHGTIGAELGDTDQVLRCQ